MYGGWQWHAPWTAQNPVRFGNSYLKATDGPVLPSAYWPGQRRELTLGKVAKGELGARHVSLKDKTALAADWLRHDGDLLMFLVINGDLELESPAGIIRFTTGEVGYIPPLTPWRVRRFTTGSELLEVTVPSEVPLLQAGTDTTQRLQQRCLTAPLPLIHVTIADQLKREDDQKGGMGLRRFWRYRDLKTEDITAGRIQIIMIETIEPPGPEYKGGTDWHDHDMCQFYFALLGWEENYQDKLGVTRTERHDSGTITCGLSHNTFRFSDNYAVVQMAVPADYATRELPEPVGFDPNLKRE